MPPTLLIGPQFSGSTRRRPSFEGGLHVERFRVTLNRLKGLTIDRPNQVWCADITYIPVRHGFLFLVAIMDWASRHVLAWRLSNKTDTSSCIEALEEALARYGKPETGIHLNWAAKLSNKTGPAQKFRSALVKDRLPTAPCQFFECHLL